MDSKVGAGNVAQWRKSDECSWHGENGSLNQVSKEAKCQVTSSRIGYNDNVTWLKYKLGYEVIVPGNGVNQGSGEGVGYGEGSGGGEPVFEGEQTVYGFRLAQQPRDHWGRNAVWMSSLHDIRSCVEVIENLLVWLCPSACGDVHPRGVVPVSWYTDGLDSCRFGPFLDLSSDELWLGLAPDACSGSGFCNGLEVGTCPDRSDSNKRGVQSSAQLKYEVDEASLV